MYSDNLYFQVIVWLVNLKEECVEVYSEPDEHGYEMIRKFYQGKTIISKIFPDLHLTVEEILG